MPTSHQKPCQVLNLGHQVDRAGLPHSSSMSCRHFTSSYGLTSFYFIAFFSRTQQATTVPALSVLMVKRAQPGAFMKECSSALLWTKWKGRDTHQVDWAADVAVHESHEPIHQVTGKEGKAGQGLPTEARGCFSDPSCLPRKSKTRMENCMSKQNAANKGVWRMLEFSWVRWRLGFAFSGWEHTRGGTGWKLVVGLRSLLCYLPATFQQLIIKTGTHPKKMEFIRFLMKVHVGCEPR